MNRRGRQLAGRWCAAAAAAHILLAESVAGPARAGESEAKGHVFYAGAYSFSDELGGFTILDVSGTGLRDDPFVIVEEFHSASPVTLTIRATAPLGRYDGGGALLANGDLYMRIEALNGSGQAWIEFEFELQEISGKPSVFGDGLSFDQRRDESDTISSDSFARYKRDFEPYDRLLYQDGKVDPRAPAGFSFFITDFTPKSIFYLVQDPRIPSS